MFYSWTLLKTTELYFFFKLGEVKISEFPKDTKYVGNIKLYKMIYWNGAAIKKPGVLHLNISLSVKFMYCSFNEELEQADKGCYTVRKCEKLLL